MKSWSLALPVAALLVAGVASGSAVPERPAAALAETTAAAAPVSARLSLWDNVLLGRYVALDGWARRYTRHYRLHHLWTVLAFASESVLDPLAQGPQVDDRGIGQVGFDAEERGRRRGANPRGRDYTPDLDPHESIWEPRTNIILACIHFRWVYDQPFVDNPRKAYAMYTDGYSAIQEDGRLSAAARRDVARAASFRGRIRSFIELKRHARSLSPGQLARLVPDRLTRGILLIDRGTRDGEPAYRKLREFYVNEIRTTGNPWVILTLGRESFSYSRLLGDVYGPESDESIRRLLSVLLKKRAIFQRPGSRDLRAAYEALLADVRQRLQ